MNKSTISKQYQLVPEGASINEVTHIIVPGTNPELPVIRIPGDDTERCKSNLYAAIDYLRFGNLVYKHMERWYHENVPWPWETEFEQQSFAAVAAAWTPPKTFNFPMFDQKDYPYGWAVLGKENGMFRWRQPNNPRSYSDKHNALDKLLLGYGLNIRISEFLAQRKYPTEPSFLEVMMEQWNETNDAKAYKMRQDRIHGAKIRRLKYQDVKKMKAAHEDNQLTAADVMSVNAETIVTLVGQGEIPLGELELGRYRVYDKSGRRIELFNWDGSIASKALIPGYQKFGLALQKI